MEPPPKLVILTGMINKMVIKLNLGSVGKHSPERGLGAGDSLRLRHLAVVILIHNSIGILWHNSREKVEG